MSANQSKPESEVTLSIILGLLVLALGSIIWVALSPLLGPVYRVLRLIETAGLWWFTGWGRYFMSVPWKSSYEFKSLFLSSVPFGILSAIFIGLIGLAAHTRVQTKHLNVHITHDRPPGYRDVMTKMAPLHPHIAFFLHFDMFSYPQNVGPAVQGTRAQDFLRQIGGLKLVEDKPEFDHETIRHRLEERFGLLNPFAPLCGKSRDHVDGYCLRGSPAQFVSAVASLPWYQVVLLYACVARIEGLYAGDDDRFAGTNKAVDRFLDQIWVDIMDLTRAVTDHQVVLGLYEGQPQGDLPFLALSDVLNAGMNGRQSVKAAREALGIMLSIGPASDEAELVELRKTLPVGPGNPEAHTRIAGMIAPHGWMFGVLAHCLETTRDGGILPPAFFRWLRFVDHDLWRFLLYVGMPTPAPEAVGKHEHYQAERKLNGALNEPFIDDAPGALEREARKYLIDLNALRGEKHEVNPS